MQQKAICFFLSIHFKIFGRAFFYVCLHGLIWAAETPEFFKIVETGDTLSAEGQDWIISPTDAGFTVPLIDEFGNTVFITHIQQTLQDPAIPSIWSINREGVATLIARWGQIAPGLDLEFESFSGLNAKGNGIIVFLATLREDPRGPALNLFKATPQGITLLARQGDPAPGFGSASNLLGAPKPAQLNNAGQVAYLAPVSSSPYNGVYLDDLRIGPESADLVAGVLLRPTDPYLGNGGKVAMTASASGGFSQITGIFSGNPADGLKAKPVNSANYASISTTMTPGIEGGTFWDPSIVSYGWDNHMVVTSQVLEPGHIGQLRRGIWTGQPDTLELLVFPEFASPLEGYSFMGGVGEISIVNPGAQIFSTNVSKGLLGEPDYEEKTILIDKTYPAGSEEVVLTVGDFIGINEADGKPSMEKFRSVDAILPSRFDVAINTTTSQDGSNLISDTLWIYSYRPNKKLRSLVRSRIDYSGIGIPRGIYTTPSTNRESGDPSSINRKGQMVFGLDMGSGKIDGIFAYDVPLSILQFDPIYPEESQKDVDPFTPVVATINPGTSEFQNFDIEFQVNGSPVPFAILPKENGTFQVSYQPGEPLSLGQEQTINLWAWHELEDEVEKSWNFTTTANPPPESAEVGVKDIQFENGQVTFTITGGEAPFSFQASEFLDEWATIAEQDDRQLTLPLLDNLPFLRAEDIVSDQRVFEFKEVSPSSSDAEIIGTITIQGREILLDLGYENLDSTQLKAIVQTQDEAEAPLYINLTSLVENSTPGRIEGTIALDPSLSGFLTNTPFARLSLREQNEEITEFEFVIEKPTFPKPVLQGPSAASEPLVNDLPTEATCKYACNDDCAGVILSTGEYTHTFNLMPIAGRGEINFSVDLFYRSRVEGPFGQWNWRYQECLNEQENGDVVRYDGRGHLRSWIKQQDGSYQPPTGHFGTLIKMEDGSFILRMPNGFKRYYDQQGRLFKYKDRFGNEMRFFFDADGQVAYILDAYDRRYDIFRDSHGNITRIQDFSGRSLWFQYDENNYLTEIITPRIVGTSTGNDFPRGRRYRCGYLSGFEGDQAFLNGNLSSLTFPNEVASGGPPAYTCTYDQNPTSPTFDHLMSYTAGGTNASGIPAGGTATFAYESVNQGVPPGDLRVPRGKATITERDGNKYEHFVNELNHHILTRRLTRSGQGLPPLRPGEPDYYETENFFDEDGQLIRRKFPEGNEVRYRFGEGSRAAEGNVVEFRRVADATRGGGEDLVETMTYEPLFNQLRSKTDPRGNASGFVPPIGSATAERYTETHSFDYQEHNLPIPDAVLFGIDLSAIPRGLGDLNGDGRTDQVQGNVILNEKAAVTLLPDSKEAERRGSTTQEIRTRYHWNDAGQRTEVVDAEGNVRQYLYHPANDPDGDGVAIPGSTQTGETGYPWKKIIDAENHPDRTAETPPLQITVEVYYNERGHPIRTVNARGVVTRIERNQQDDPIKIIEGFELTKPLETGEDPLARVVEVHYDANCNIISSETDNRDSASEPLNVSIDRTYTYDILNNQVAYSQEVDESESLTWLFEFSPDEKLVAKRAPAGTWITQILDERRLPLSVTQGAGTPEASTITTAFDKNGNITVIFDAEDNDGDGEPESTTVAYDGFDRPVRVTDALGNETTREYDVASNIIRKTTMGHPANSPDAPNILLAECIWDYDEGNRRYLEYSGRWFLDDQENIINIEIKDLEDEDNDGYVAVRSEYDALCRPTFEWEDDLEVRETVYDGANRPIAKIDAIGNRLDVDYDLNGNPIQMTRTERSSGEIVPDEIFTTRYVFDQLDRVVRATDNLGQTTYLGYDRRDNLVYRADPEGEPTSDPLGLLEGEINLPGNTVRWVFDGLDRKIKQVIDLRIGGTGQGNLDTSNLFNPDGQITLNYEWDENSRLAAIIDDNNNKTSFGYDALNRRTAEIRPDGTRYDAVYDRDNNVRKVTDPNGSVITKSFDALNRVIQVDIDRAPGVEGTTRETYGYDGLSNLTSATDDNGDEGDTITSIFIYDSLSRILEEQQTIGDNTQAISRIWSGDGKKIQEIYPGGRKISYTHDAIDRVTQVADESGVISAHAWIGPGYRELLRSLGNGTSLSFLNDAKDQVTGYDDVRRKTRLRHLGPGENPEAFIDREYGFNRANKQIRETRHDDFSQVNTMLLDSFYRTVEVIYDDGDTGPKRETIQTEYTLDGVGNRRTVRALSSTAVPSSVNFQVNPLNQYSQIGETARIHSANGNLTNNGQYTCSYDYKNRLVLVSDNATGNQVASYLFDCGNRRCQKTVFDPDTGNTISETDYFYSGPQCVEEQDAATGNTLVTYQWSPEYIDSCNQFERTEHHPLGAGRFWVHCDRQHNVAAITNSDGEVVEKRFFDDFGRMYDDLKNPMSSSGVSGLEFGFQGRRCDFETGLYYFRNRYYDPGTGRFIQRDPMWDARNVGGYYSFAGNNPWSGMDPFGTNSDQRDGWDKLGEALYTIFIGSWFDPINEFVDKYGFEGVFYAIGSGICAIATLPMEFIEAFQSYESIRETIIEQLDEDWSSGDGLSYYIINRIESNRREFMESEKNQNDLLRKKWDRIEAHFASDLHWRFGYYVEWLTGGAITAWDAMNMWPDGGLTGVEEMGSESVGFENIACMHDALIYLNVAFDVGPGAGLCREKNVFSGMISNFLRVTFSGNYGHTGFGDPGEPGVERPFGSLPGEKTPEAYGGWAYTNGGIFPTGTPAGPDQTVNNGMLTDVVP